MRRLLLLPGVLALSVAFIGCGGGEDAQTPEKPAETDAAAGTTKVGEPEVAATPETKTDTPAKAEPKSEEQPKTAAAGKPTSMATGDRVGVDTTYVLPEAVAVLVVHPQQLLKSPLLSENPTVAGQLAATSKKFGVDPSDIDEIVISGGPPTGPEGIQEPVSIVATFSKPHGGKAMLDKMAADNDEIAELVDVEYAGTTFYHAVPAKPAEGDDAAEPSPFEPPKPQATDSYVLLADETTAIVAQDEAVIKKLIDGKGSVKTPLTEALAKVDASSDLVLLVKVNDQLREMAASQTDRAAGTPYEKLPEQLDMAVVRATISPDIRVQSTISLVDEQAAGEFAKAITQSVQEASTGLDAQLKQMEAAPPGGPASMMLPVLKEVQKMLAGISTEQAGADVVIDMAGLNDINYQTLMQAAMMIAMMQGMGGPGGPGPGPGPGDFEPPADDIILPDPADEAPADDKEEEA
ncbi:hypothetical protein [Symmachiella dynata]|uniref:hypothetical protein n=1 Tax=Symmachiella dynata TaxID=2527995 RepID=UPI0030EEA459